ncbi:MAG: hypothetical protein ACYCTI_01445 [Acidimicrobiales bacterium]
MPVPLGFPVGGPVLATVRLGAPGGSTVEVEVPVAVLARVLASATTAVTVSVRLAELAAGAVPAKSQVQVAPAATVVPTGLGELVQVTGLAPAVPSASVTELRTSGISESLVITTW